MNFVGIGQGQNIVFQSHPLYLALDKVKEFRQSAYRELFRMHLDAAEIHTIRKALNQELVLGREDFKDKIEIMLKRQTRPA